jgi:hypothetical protein
MAIVLDADVIIRGERGTFDLSAWVDGQPEEKFAVASIMVVRKRRGIQPPIQRHGRLTQAWLGLTLVPD